MVALRNLLPGARRRKRPRTDAPKTIVPPRAQPRGPAVERIDAARERLRREIPPRQDED